MLCFLPCLQFPLRNAAFMQYSSNKEALHCSRAGRQSILQASQSGEESTHTKVHDMCLSLFTLYCKLDIRCLPFTSHVSGRCRWCNNRQGRSHAHTHRQVHSTKCSALNAQCNFWKLLLIGKGLTQACTHLKGKVFAVEGRTSLQNSQQNRAGSFC